MSANHIADKQLYRVPGTAGNDTAQEVENGNQKEYDTRGGNNANQAAPRRQAAAQVYPHAAKALGTPGCVSRTEGWNRRSGVTKST